MFAFLENHKYNITQTINVCVIVQGTVLAITSAPLVGSILLALGVISLLTVEKIGA